METLPKITIHIERWKLEALKAIAERNGSSYAWQLRKAVGEYLAARGYKKPEPEKS